MTTMEVVIQILSMFSAEEPISAEHTLQENLDLDSLAMVSLLVELEEAFAIQLDEADMNPYDLVTVQDVVDLVDKYTVGGDSSE